MTGTERLNCTSGSGHRRQFLRPSLVFTEHADPFLYGEVAETPAVVDPADPPEDDPVTDDLLPGEQQRMIVDMGGLRACSIHFDDGEILSLPQFLPGIIPDIQPSEIELRDLPADLVDREGQLLIDEMGIIGKAGPAGMIAIGHQNAFLGGRQYGVEEIAMSEGKAIQLK